MYTTIDGVNILNATPHPIRFQSQVTGEIITVEMSGYKLKANAVETTVSTGVVTLVKTVFVASDEGLDELENIQAYRIPNLMIVGSIISAQAFPGSVVGMVPVPGTERAAPQDKLYLPNKFTTFA